MGDAGEGIVDAESRIQERLEELQREAEQKKRKRSTIDPELARQLESLSLARTQLERQLQAVASTRRRTQLEAALADLDARIAACKVSRDGGA
jgi:septal ring factor EnvC (AmiA/AmiB activator)